MQEDPDDQMYGNREAIITSGVDDKPKPGDNLTNVPNRPPKAAPRALSPLPPVVAPRNGTGPPPVAPRTETSACVRMCMCACIRPYVHVCVSVCACVCVHVCVFSALLISLLFHSI